MKHNSATEYGDNHCDKMENGELKLFSSVRERR